MRLRIEVLSQSPNAVIGDDHDGAVALHGEAIRGGALPRRDGGMIALGLATVVDHPYTPGEFSGRCQAMLAGYRCPYAEDAHRAVTPPPEPYTVDPWGLAGSV